MIMIIIIINTGKPSESVLQSIFFEVEIRHDSQILIFLDFVLELPTITSILSLAGSEKETEGVVYHVET